MRHEHVIGLTIVAVLVAGILSESVLVAAICAIAAATIFGAALRWL